MKSQASTTAVGTAFEKEVADYYRGLGYAVEQGVDINGQQVDVLATLPQPDGQPYRVMIECKWLAPNKRAGNDAIQSIAKAYTLAKQHHLVEACTVVTNNGFSLPGKRIAAADGIHLLTRAELTSLTQRTPWRHALALSLSYNLASESTPHFIHGRGRTHPGDTAIPDVAEYLYSRVTSDRPGFTLLFAGPGTGKTTQLMKLADRLTKDYLAGAQVPLALYIPLERFTRHRDAQYFDDFVVAYLRAQYRMQDVGWVDIATWLSRRSAVVLLDGFDEIKQLHTDLSVIDEFEHISTILGRECCAVLSCRTALAARFSDPLSTQLSMQLTEQGHRVPDVAVLEIFTSQEIEQYLDLAKAPRSLLGGGIARAVLRRPLFLRLAVDTIDGDAATHVTITTEAELLERCIRQLLLRSNLRHASINKDQWRTFLEHCALQMMLDDKTSIEPAGLTAMVKQHFHFHDKDIQQLQDAEFDARVRTVFDFDLSASGLRWAHSIFRDYFAASAIAVRLLDPQPQDATLDGRSLTLDQVAFMRYCVERLQHRWKALLEFRRPAQEPAPISAANPWKWISPGLGVITSSDSAEAHLALLSKGFWISAQPLSHGDVRSLGTYWTQRDLVEYRGRRNVRPDTPLTNITHLDATRLAARLEARLPAESEWERAARWIDGSYPKPDVMPRADTASGFAPVVTGAAGNPWDVRNAVGSVWQWTTAFDTTTQRYVCRGPWWGATMDEKLAAGRLLPREPSHIRTGLRIVKDPASGGEL